VLALGVALVGAAVGQDRGQAAALVGQELDARAEFVPLGRGAEREDGEQAERGGCTRRGFDEHGRGEGHRSVLSGSGGCGSGAGGGEPWLSPSRHVTEW